MEIYYTPFKLGLWICLILFLLILAIIKTIFVDPVVSIYSAINSFTWNIFFNLAPILEDWVSIPNKIVRSSKLKLIFGLWIFEAIVLSQYYNSFYISSLLAPVPTQGISTFEHISDFKLEKENGKYYLAKVIEGILALRHESKNIYYQTFRILSAQSFFYFTRELPNNILVDDYGGNLKKCWDFNFLDSYKFPSELKNMLKCLKKSSFEPALKISSKLLFILSQFTKYYEFVPLKNRNQVIFDNARIVNLSLDMYDPLNDVSSFIEDELLKCNKTVLAINENSFNPELKYLTTNYPGIKFYTIEDAIAKGNDGLAFENAGNSKIVSYFKFFFQGGIYKYWVDRYYLITNYRRKIGTKQILQFIKKLSDVSALNLENCSFVTFFYIWLGCLILTILVFLVESETKYGKRWIFFVFL